ncbi:unnamed protein product [Rotaria socialis]|uniref:Uncharacterized protein n=2 Tax=Rotaria socialis TaxID=392032 RepID=A0A818ZAS7_9BILA|nr:unnamed protein product [Rotaria socialis]CAF3337242.1 unnamed protein product [Rotaria socialis]CAF3766167.1 unnamed protein product [Rotaria socialis]CAF4449935.1 unnamed protein product [Rotaria socialis]
MNKMDDKHRHHPYYRTEHSTDRRYDDSDNRQRYRHRHEHASSSRNERFHNKNQINYSNQQKSNTKSYSYCPSSLPVPLMASKAVNSSTFTCTSVTAIPQERESWIRSVKKTKINESNEQKTQYLETMLRMPQQQKSSINSSTFDRMRFANEERPTSTFSTEHADNIHENSFHFVSNANSYGDINTIERILFDQSLQTINGQCLNPQLLPTSPPSIVDGEPVLQKNFESLPYSGFLIDNCDEVEDLCPLSSLPRIPFSLSPTTENVSQQNQNDLNEQRAILVHELNAADAEQKEIARRQKRMQRKIQKKKNQEKIENEVKQLAESEPTSTVNTKDHQESASDWIVEYDTTETNSISQLTNMIRRASATMTSADTIAQVNAILKKIKKQQTELSKLRQFVISILDEEQKRNSTNTTRNNSDINQDRFLAFLNQPTISGCWLCAGKNYTETATQCNGIDQ